MERDGTGMALGSNPKVDLDHAGSIGPAADALRISFEVPLNEREANSRALPESVSRLLLSRRSSDIDVRVFVGLCAELIQRCSEVVFRCGTQAALIESLISLDCEELVVFCACGDRAAEQVVSAARAYRGRGPGYDAPFVCTDTGLRGVEFYSASHVSLEVLGEREFVVDRCLPCVLTHVLRSAAWAGGTADL